MPGPSYELAVSKREKFAWLIVSVLFVGLTASGQFIYWQMASEDFRIKEQAHRTIQWGGEGIFAPLQQQLRDESVARRSAIIHLQNCLRDFK